MLYNIFIQPLVIILRAIYLGINYFAGNLGISLMILSVVMSILLRPFSKWAVGIQDKERKIQNILSPQIAEIKQTFHGAEQHEELSELYKRYAYNPIYAIRSGLDLFVQLLPLMAAYIMLSELEIIKGVSFYAIKDLSKPDNLLAGINLLPFVMTGFNVLATITTKKFTKRERVQAFIIAALFLVMLYNAPSALLIYWTTNNFIMLVKNIDFYGIFGGDKIAGALDYRFVPVGWKKIFVNLLTIIIPLFVLGAYLIYFYKTFIDKLYLQLGTLSVMHNIYFFAFVAAAILVIMLYMKFIANGFTIREFLVKTILLAVFTAGILLFIKLVLFNTQTFRRMSIYVAMLLFYAMLAFLLPVSGEKLCGFASRFSNNKYRTSLFFSSALFSVIFICVLYPSLLYRSDPDFFVESFVDTITRISVYGMTLLFALILIWPLIPKFVQNILAFTAAFLVCMAFINSFVLTESYGNLNALKIDDSMMKIGRALPRDLISLAITSVIIFICIERKYLTHLITAFVLISFAMCGVSVYCYFNIKQDSTPIASKSIFPEYHNRLWRFSRTGKNVICFFFDGFTSDHVIRILSEHPDLINTYDGFIYFPDNMSTGSWTVFSTPAIYGGPAYKPNTLNERTDVTITDKYIEAFSFLPNIFTSKSFDVSISTPTLNNIIDSRTGVIYKDSLKHPESVLILESGWHNDYLQNWEQWGQKNGISVAIKNKEDISSFLFVLSLFRAIPFSIRGKVYNNGAWMGGASGEFLKTMLLQHTLPQLAALQFIGDFVHADDGPSTFKMIYNSLSHVPCFLESDSLQLVRDPYPQIDGQSTHVDGLFPEHYFTEKHMMYFVANFISALKKAGVYDNTRIVIVADHDFSDSWKLNTNPDWKLHNNWPNAILMFKDFDSHGDIITSDALMSIEDTPALLIAGIDTAPGISTLEELKQLSSADRVRINCGHSMLPPTSTMFSLDGGVYQVKGTMFKPENWTKIQ